MTRARIPLAVAAAACLLGGVAEAQAPCTARPRWIAVTIVEGTAAVGIESEHETLKAGQHLLDRCVAGEPDFVAVRDAAAAAHPPRGANAKTHITFAWFRTKSATAVFVEETVQEICAAMGRLRGRDRPLIPATLSRTEQRPRLQPGAVSTRRFPARCPLAREERLVAPTHSHFSPDQRDWSTQFRELAMLIAAPPPPPLLFDVEAFLAAMRRAACWDFRRSRDGRRLIGF